MPAEASNAGSFDLFRQPATRTKLEAECFIRVNLRHVPEEMRPAQGAPDPDDDPTRGWREARGGG